MEHRKTRVARVAREGGPPHLVEVNNICKSKVENPDRKDNGCDGRVSESDDNNEQEVRVDPAIEHLHEVRSEDSFAPLLSCHVHKKGQGGRIGVGRRRRAQKKRARTHTHIAI